MADPPETADNLSADSTNPPETLTNRTEDSRISHEINTLNTPETFNNQNASYSTILPVTSDTATEESRLRESDSSNPPAMSNRLTAEYRYEQEIVESPIVDSTNSLETADAPTVTTCESADERTSKSADLPITPVTMDELCRLCLVRCSGEMQRIFDDVAFPDNILALAQLQMHLGDGLPEHVCHHCVYQMKSALAFVTQCRESDVTLRDYLHELHLARTLLDPVRVQRDERVSEAKEATALAVDAVDHQQQSDREGSGDAVRVSADCSEKTDVAAPYSTSILSGLLRRPTNTTIRRERERAEREADDARREREDNASRDVASSIVVTEMNTRQPMDITNVVNNRHHKDSVVKNGNSATIIEHYTTQKKPTNCDKAQDLITNIVSGFTKTYSGEENNSLIRENKLSRGTESKSGNGFITNEGHLLKTIKSLSFSKDNVFDHVESQLELMMKNSKSGDNKDASVKLLNGRSKDQNKRNSRLHQVLDDLKGKLYLPNAMVGKQEIAEELRNGLNKQNCKKARYGKGEIYRDVSPKRSLCEELLSSFRAQVIESMTVYVGSTDNNVIKEDEAQVKDEVVENNVVVEVLPDSKEVFQTTVSVDAGKCLAETITNGVETEPEQEHIVIRVLDPESHDIHASQVETSGNVEVNYSNQEDYHVIVGGNTEGHVKEEEMEVENCPEEPYSSAEVITGDVITMPTNGELLRCKLEEGTETDKVYMGNEINGEIMYFDVQEEVVIETEDFDLNSMAIEESTETLDYPGPSNEAVVIKKEVTGEYAFACETCTKSFKRKKALLSHLQLHTFINFGGDHKQKKDPTNKLYKCEVCFKCYISKAGLKIHRNRVHEEGKFSCPECDSLFASKVLLVAHLKTHKQKVYKCNRCMKTFQKRKTFVAHTRIHAQNVYKCATCLETYGDEDDLKEHFKTHKAHDVATGQSMPPSRNEAQVEQFQRMKFEYCLSYVGLVKSMFETQPDLYNGFLDTIKDFKFQRINVQGLLVQISQLFKDHRELIAGFNTFMPHGFKIELPHEDKSSGVAEVVPVPDQQGPDMDLDYSLSYLSQIKSMFSSQPKIYNDFTYIIKEYKLKTMEIPEVIRRVSHLFRDYPELIAGFNSFLPPWCKIKVTANAKKEKEDIDPMDPSVRPGPSGTSAPTPCNGSKPSDLSSPAANLVNLGRNHKRKVVLPANSVDHFKKVKMELLSSDKVFKTINQANKVPETPRDEPRPAENVEAVEVSSVQPQSQNIVETITSLCDQLQTIVDKQGYTAATSETIDQSQGGDDTAGTDVGVYSHVCHVCLKSFQKRSLLQAHQKEHKR